MCCTYFVLYCCFIIVRLRNSNIRVKFVTNATKESLCSVHDKLTKMGFDVGQEEIFTSLTVARTFVERRSLRPFLLLEESAKDDFGGQLSFHAVIYQYSVVCTYLFAHIRSILKQVQIFRNDIVGAQLQSNTNMKS